MIQILATIIVILLVAALLIQVLKELLKDPVLFVLVLILGLLWVWGYCITEFIKAMAKALP